MNLHELGMENEQAILLIHPSVVKWDYFEYVIPLLETAYHEMFRILKPGGTLCINDMDCIVPIRWVANKVFPHLKSGDVKMYCRQETEDMLRSAGFKAIKYRKISSFSFLCTARKGRTISCR